MNPLPILWSFRRCPFAIRARLAIAAAGVPVELREVALSCKPPELLQIWPAGTVPVLQMPDGRVIGGSLAVMRWALAQRDPQGWLQLPGEQGPGAEGDPTGYRSVIPSEAPPDTPPAVGRAASGEPTSGPAGSSPPAAWPALPAAIEALIAANDGPFKQHLDRFKYASRFPGSDAGHHRREGLRILRRWDGLLRASAQGPESGGWLLGQRSCLADWALLPFVRQFRLADPQGFAAAEGLEALRLWLQRFEAGPELAAVMAPPLAFRQPWPSPQRLYHLALAGDWQQAQADGDYRCSTRGLSLEEVGFIHASQAHQIEATYRRFYADAGPVRLLTIDPQQLAAAGVDVVEEPAAEGSGELFPHLYGPLPLKAVLAAEPYRPEPAAQPARPAGSDSDSAAACGRHPEGALVTPTPAQP